MNMASDSSRPAADRTESIRKTLRKRHADLVIRRNIWLSILFSSLLILAVLVASITASPGSTVGRWISSKMKPHERSSSRTHQLIISAVIKLPDGSYTLYFHHNSPEAYDQSRKLAEADQAHALVSVMWNELRVPTGRWAPTVRPDRHTVYFDVFDEGYSCVPSIEWRRRILLECNAARHRELLEVLKDASAIAEAEKEHERMNSLIQSVPMAEAPDMQSGFPNFRLVFGTEPVRVAGYIINAVSILMLGLVAVSIHRSAVHIRRSMTLQSAIRNCVCPTCRYELRGLVENRCPECGEVFEEATTDPGDLR